MSTSQINILTTMPIRTLDDLRNIPEGQPVSIGVDDSADVKFGLGLPPTKGILVRENPGSAILIRRYNESGIFRYEVMDCGVGTGKIVHRGEESYDKYDQILRDATKEFEDARETLARNGGIKL